MVFTRAWYLHQSPIFRIHGITRLPGCIKYNINKVFSVFRIFQLRGFSTTDKYLSKYFKIQYSIPR